MVRFKVRPRRDAIFVPCSAEMSSLLACFAATADLRAASTCADAAKALHGCMAKGGGGRGRPGKSSINHLLNKVR